MLVNFIKNSTNGKLGAIVRKTEIVIKALNREEEVKSDVISGLITSSDIEAMKHH